MELGGRGEGGDAYNWNKREVRGRGGEGMAGGSAFNWNREELFHFSVLVCIIEP